MPFSFTVSKFLITTGWNQNGYPRDSEILDLSIKGGSNCNDWPDFPKDVDAATGGMIQDVVVICGGGDANTEFNECYSLNGNAATLITHMSAKRQYAASLVIDNTKLWITGGLYLASSEYITLEGIEPGPELPTIIDSHALVAMDNTLSMLIGGSTNGYDATKKPTTLTIKVTTGFKDQI